jgi:methylmalonyl-CoA mutase
LKISRTSIGHTRRGADSLRFTIEDDTIDIGKLLEKLPLENVAVYFNFKFFSIDFVKTIDSIIQHKKAIAYYNMDPMGQLARDGIGLLLKIKIILIR